MTRTEIGTINDAAKRYGTDAAGVWGMICSDRVHRLTDGREVIVVAEPERRQGTLWIVEEIEL